ncbi:variable surface protein [Plasmodium gonderi]|uniref:Variable surface protein n=1 Tax=Plasmodium gonderi TaxID=77519 RepID=A0A1Y1JSN5_PLAGO|nr:variable surface protein [Plasmodium gonderi]GAW84465.1 variable surface protein [Plasmodium gonderi]
MKIVMRALQIDIEWSVYAWITKFEYDISYSSKNDSIINIIIGTTNGYVSTGINALNNEHGIRESNNKYDTESVVPLDEQNMYNHEIIYKKYIIMVLVPLAIILILMLIIKYTHFRIIFTKKKRKKRKMINEKLQRVLLGPAAAREKHVQFAYSYFDY